MHSLLDRSVHWGYGCFRGRFPVAPSSYIKLVKVVYRQRLNVLLFDTLEGVTSTRYFSPLLVKIELASFSCIKTFPHRIDSRCLLDYYKN